MKNLYERGVLLIKGKSLDEAKSSLLLHYNGKVIAKGDQKRISRLIQKLKKTSNKDFFKFLRKAHGDPTFKVWGPGVDSHPKEWEKIVKELKSHGAKFKYSDESMTYGPRFGEPGEVTLTRDASITALMHEAQHFYYDKSKGFPGLGRLISDPKIRWENEFAAYMEEVNFLRGAGEFSIAKEVLNLARKEKAVIEKEYKVKL